MVTVFANEMIYVQNQMTISNNDDTGQTPILSHVSQAQYQAPELVT